VGERGLKQMYILEIYNHDQLTNLNRVSKIETSRFHYSDTMYALQKRREEAQLDHTMRMDVTY